MGIGDWGWGLGIGDWGLGPIPNPQYYLFNIEILLKMNIYIHKEIKLINK